MGPLDAAVTVVSYGDYQCPDCHRRHREIQKVVDELSKSVRFVFRHFPLIRVHPHALQAAAAAEVAGAQGKFWEMHRRLYLSPDKLSDKDLRHHAREIGLDLASFDREMESGQYSDLVLKSYHESLVLGITGVPTTYINGVLYAMSGDELLANARKIVSELAGSR